MVASRLLLLAACIAVAPPARAQTRIWREDDRIAVTSFNNVAALTTDGRRVFAATANGLEVYDAFARRWLPASTAEDGYPFYARPTAALYDRSQGGLWLLTGAGVFFWSDLSGRWENRAFGAPDSLLTEANRRARAAEGDPAWRVMRGTIGSDASGRRWQLSAITPADRPGTFWVGTNGNNILLADTRNLGGEWLTYGSLARGSSAVAVAANGTVWFGGDGLGPRDGVTLADSALQRWATFESYSSRAPRAQVNQILPGDTTWLAAVDGLYRLLPNARTWQRFDERDGLPSDNVRAIARTDAGLWVGTSRGVAIVEPVTGRSKWSGLMGERVYGLAARNDSVWIASHLGLLIGTADSIGHRVVHANENPAFRAPVTGVARFGTSMAVLTATGVHTYDGTQLNDATLSAIGRPLYLRGNDDYFYVLGARGVAEWVVTTREWRYLSVPGDIMEGPVRDVARSGPFMWVATPGGTIRLRWP